MKFLIASFVALLVSSSMASHISVVPHLQAAPATVNYVSQPLVQQVVPTYTNNVVSIASAPIRQYVAPATTYVQSASIPVRQYVAPATTYVQSASIPVRQYVAPAVTTAQIVPAHQYVVPAVARVAYAPVQTIVRPVAVATQYGAEGFIRHK